MTTKRPPAGPPSRRGVPKERHGWLLPAERRLTAEDPGYLGKVTVEGKTYRVEGWLRTSAKHRLFVRFRLEDDEP